MDHRTGIRSDEGLTLETSALESLYGGQFTLFINSVDKTKFLCTTPPPTQHHSFFRNYPFYSFVVHFQTNYQTRTLSSDIPAAGRSLFPKYAGD